MKYQHVERIDSDEAEGLLDGPCHVFPKMDGSNMCAYLEDGIVRCQSRNRVLDGTEPFAIHVSSHPEIGEFLRAFPGLRLYGEWMVPHTVRSYVPGVWNRWFVFDVIAEDKHAVYRTVLPDGTLAELDCAGRFYLPYETYVPLLEAFGIEYIPSIAVIEGPSRRELERLADEESGFMVAEGCGEGVVVKRYGYSNRYGRTVWAKVLSSRFSVFKIASCSSRREERKDGTSVEHEIAMRYVTTDLVDKEYSKMLAEGSPRKAIPGRLLATVWYCMVHESMWDAVKKFHEPVLDMKALRKECEARTKTLRPEVFGLRALEVTEE